MLLSNPLLVSSQKKQHDKTKELLKALEKIKHEDIKHRRPLQLLTPIQIFGKKYHLRE